MWPFSEMSLTTAALVGSIANWALLASLGFGLLSTFVIVKTTDVKEEHWARLREGQQDRLAELGVRADEARAELAKAQAETAKANAATEQLRKENLELEQAIAPRSLEIMAPIEALKPFAGTKVMLGGVDDIEVQRLVWSLREVLQAAGWSVSPDPPPGRVYDGVEVGFIFGDIHDTPENKTRGLNDRGQQAAKALVAALEKQNIETKELGLSTVGGAGEWPGLPDDTIAVRVGLRPSTYFMLRKYPDIKKRREDDEKRRRDLEEMFSRRQEQFYENFEKETGIRHPNDPRPHP